MSLRLLLPALLLVACAHNPPPPPAAPPVVEAPPQPAAVPRRGELTRAALDRTLDAGPGAFLGTVSVRVVSSGRRFVGWEVLALDPDYADAGFHPGDVIVRVNGRSIERPDDLTVLWDSLRTAREIVFDIRRRGVDDVVHVPVKEK